MPAQDVTAADIARLAGVGRAAVSNWRRRHADFPRPVGGPPTSPTFAFAEVEAWLRANGKAIDGASAVRAQPRADAQAELAEIVASLLPPLRHGIVLDPACGTGVMLATVARRLGPSVRYAAQDSDAANVAATTNALAEAGARDAEAVVGSPFDADALARHRGAADASLCLPPTGSWPADESSVDLPWAFGAPPPLESSLAWLQACYAYLKPGGHAIVPMPYAAAVRASGRRIRAELLRSGALRQVVALPEWSAGRAPAPWQVWLLHRPASRPGYTVRLVDLTDAEPGDIPIDAKGWRAVYADGARTRDVASIELLDEDVLLVPARHIEPPVRDVSDAYARLRADLAAAVEGLRAELPPLRRGRQPAMFAMTTIVDLLRGGALAFIDRGAPVRAGDVIVPGGSHRFDATVLADPATIPAHRAATEVIRCEPDLLDAHFLACFLRSEVNRRQATGTQGGTFRLDLRRARVPRLPLAEQRRYGEAFRRLTAITGQLTEVVETATNAVGTGVYGLTSGVLLPDNAD